MTLGARKTQQQASDDIDLDPADFAEIDAAIDESDAQIAAGEPGISAEESIERRIDESDAYFAAGNKGIPADVVLAEVRQILRG